MGDQISDAIVCTRTGCSGTIVEGYCDECGRAAAMPADRAGTGPGTGLADGPIDVHVPTGRTRRDATSAPKADAPVEDAAIVVVESTPATVGGRESVGLGRGIVEVASVSAIDPRRQVLADPLVPERDRRCAWCDRLVGQSKAGRPGRTSGFCPSCRHPFDFEPKLHPGDVLAGQYEVAGCLAHGGLGWVYLATDRNVSERWVVLKGIIDARSPDARHAALAERQFLATVEHPEIVKIYNFLADAEGEYIVMEYVAGMSLTALLRGRRDRNGGLPDPFPPDVAIAYVLGILPALGYLHDRGLVYCDFKPDNIIHVVDRLKLIDLGGARRLGDPSDVFGTVGFQAPEIAEVGPSIQSDLYTVLRTLAVLCLDFRGYTTRHRFGPPPVDEYPILREFDSLRRLFERGLDADPARRFQSVAELETQLLGVLRECAAVRAGEPRPGASTVFTPEIVALGDSVQVDAPTWRVLPYPLISPSDPAAAYLVNLPPARVGATAPMIEAAVRDGQILNTVEAMLRRVRDHLDASRSDPEQLQHALRLLAGASGEVDRDWRVQWYRGLASLVAGQTDAARGAFSAVRGFLPGELAPVLALAVTEEQSGAFDAAAALYRRVVAVDPGYQSATFGLGRCLAAGGDVHGSIDAYERVPGGSTLREHADAAQARALLRRGAGAIGLDAVIAAARSVDRLPVDSQRYEELEFDVLLAALGAVRSGTDTSGTAVLGVAMEERALRRALERNRRRMARRVPDGAPRVAMVDAANRIRPRTLW
jgi:serine/threonine-protein kinase PknG